MKNLNVFDALIVYTETLAVSASVVANRLPFPKESRSEAYNRVYGYFLEMCEMQNMKVAFTTSADITGAGLCSSYWLYENSKWKRKNSACYSELIFEKFSPVRKGIKRRREILFSNEKIKSFNDPELFGLFFDKQRTYDELKDQAIPTVSLLGRTPEEARLSCKVLCDLMKNHPGFEDFSDDVVMKDRFGAGGRHIYKFKIGQADRMAAVARRHPRVSFIIQPFAEFDKGFSYLSCSASTDIRLIFLNGKVVQFYIRMAKPGDFRCNEHQGGTLTYLPIKQIPQVLREKARTIAEMLDKKSFYSLDFIISNKGNAYLLEGNTGPGLDWNESLVKNETEAKKLIVMLAGELSVRADLVRMANEELPLGGFVPLVSRVIVPIVV